MPVSGPGRRPSPTSRHAPGQPARREHEGTRNGTQCLFAALQVHHGHEVQAWLAEHPRWSLQFTPKHASWLNQIEIFFSILYRRLLKHAIFTSQDDLATQMLAYIRDETAKPFKWTYTGKVLEA